MRKFLVPLLMASAMMPAAAFARPDRDQSEEARKERSSEDRPQQAERAVRADRPVRVERSERPTRVEHVQRVERTVNEPRAERQQVVRERPRQDDRQVRRTDRNLADGFRAIAREQRDGDNVEVRRRDGGAVTGIPNRDGRTPGFRPSSLVERLAPRSSVRLAQLSPAPSLAIPAGSLLRSLWLELSPLLDRLQLAAELLQLELLAGRSLDVSPSAGLRSVPLGPLL